MKLRNLNSTDLSMMARHVSRLAAENGRDGDFIFSPNEVGHSFTAEDLKKYADAIAKSVETPGWKRTWIVTDDKEIFGELTLVHRSGMKSWLHRCLLMMGIERSIRNQGWGSKLMAEAISWTKAQPTLDWIDLNVFENNLPAKALYKKFGFESIGTTADMFRVFGQSIDDTQMVLKIR